MPMENLNIHHDESRKGFFAGINGTEAEITYREKPNGTLVYHHTYVPDELRGQGIAGKITRFALDWAREKGKLVRATCPYIVKYLEDHPEYEDITV